MDEMGSVEQLKIKLKGITCIFLFVIFELRSHIPVEQPHKQLTF